MGEPDQLCVSRMVPDSLCLWQGLALVMLLW